MRPAPLPVELGSRFSVAQARTLGVDRGRLRRADIRSPFHGVRRRDHEGLAVDDDRCGRPLGPLEKDHLTRAHDLSVRLGPDVFFSHVTAAVVWGMPLPPSVLAHAPVHVAVMAPRRLPRIRGVHGHETTAILSDVDEDPWSGLRVVAPATAWAMLGAVLQHPFDLAAAGDAAIRTWRRTAPLTSLEQLEAAIAAGRRVGVNALREALPLLATRSASRPETWCRLILAEARLPEPALNFAAYGPDGRYLGAIDIAFPDDRVAVEYEGEHHLRDPQQWDADIRRYEALAAAGWIVVRVTKTELFGSPASVVRRVRAALASRRVSL